MRQNQKSDLKLPAPTKENIKSVVKLRKANEADISFIFNSWLKSYRASAKAILPAVYFQFQHQLIEQLLKRSTVTVACNPADESQIYGYVVHEVQDGVDVLHYGYVKQDFRGLGLLKHMLGNVTTGFYTHNTSMAPKALKQFIFNPYLVQK